MNRQTLEPERYFQALPAHIAGLRVTAEGRRLLTGYADGMLKVLHSESGYGHIRICQLYSVEQLALYPDGSLRLWELQSGACLRMMKGHDLSIQSVCVSKDGRTVISAGADATLRLWNLKTGHCHGVIEVGSRVNDAAVTADNSYILSADMEGYVKTWDEPELNLSCKRCRHTLRVNPFVVDFR